MRDAGYTGVPSSLAMEKLPIGQRNGKDATVWLRSIRSHTYLGRVQNEGDIYLAHEDMVETIVDVLKFAVRDTPPKRATR